MLKLKVAIIMLEQESAVICTFTHSLRDLCFKCNILEDLERINTRVDVKWLSF